MEKILEINMLVFFIESWGTSHPTQLFVQPNGTTTGTEFQQFLHYQLVNSIYF